MVIAPGCILGPDVEDAFFTVAHWPVLILGHVERLRTTSPDVFVGQTCKRFNNISSDCSLHQLQIDRLKKD